MMTLAGCATTTPVAEYDRTAAVFRACQREASSTTVRLDRVLPDGSYRWRADEHVEYRSMMPCLARYGSVEIETDVFPAMRNFSPPVVRMSRPTTSAP